MFPTCAMLKEFIDSSASAEGEKAIFNGRFTIDPDGPGKVKPFTVTCQFPATIVELTPGLYMLACLPVIVCRDISVTKPQPVWNPIMPCLLIRFTLTFRNPLYKHLFRICIGFDPLQIYIVDVFHFSSMDTSCKTDIL